MIPIFVSIISRLKGLYRVCQECQKTQIVSSDKKWEPVECKFCGNTIPAPSDK